MKNFCERLQILIVSIIVFAGCQHGDLSQNHENIFDNTPSPNLWAIQGCLALYKETNGCWPTSLSELQAFCEIPPSDSDIVIDWKAIHNAKFLELNSNEIYMSFIYKSLNNDKEREGDYIELKVSVK